MISLDTFPEEVQEFFKDLASEKNPPQPMLARVQKTLGEYGEAELMEATYSWILAKSRLPWLELDVEYPRDEMLQEALAVMDRFVPHRDVREGYDSRGWFAICLHGLSAEKTFDERMYGYEKEEDAPFKWTDVADLCPITTKFFKETYPCNHYYRVRFVKLAPGGYIPPHVDRKQSLLWETNFALTDPPGHHFKMEGQGYIPFKEGKAFILDVSNKHSVVNLSEEDRIHMIVHGKAIDEKPWHDLIEKSFRKFLRNLKRES